jgi:hypothetical protein
MGKKDKSRERAKQERKGTLRVPKREPYKRDKSQNDWRTYREEDDK